jgi:hypothetical protein
VTPIIEFVLYGLTRGSSPGDWKLYPDYDFKNGPLPICRTHSTRTLRRVAAKTKTRKLK